MARTVSKHYINTSEKRVGAQVGHCHVRVSIVVEICRGDVLGAAPRLRRQKA